MYNLFKLKITKLYINLLLFHVFSSANSRERIPAALRLGDQAKSPVSQSRVPVSLRLGTSLPGVVMEPVEKEKPVKRKPGRPQ